MKMLREMFTLHQAVVSVLYLAFTLRFIWRADKDIAAAYALGAVVTVAYIFFFTTARRRK